MWSDLEEAPIPNINEFSQLFSRQAVEPKVAKKKTQQKKKTEVKTVLIVFKLPMLHYYYLYDIPFQQFYRNLSNCWTQKDHEMWAY